MNRCRHAVGAAGMAVLLAGCTAPEAGDRDAEQDSVIAGADSVDLEDELRSAVTQLQEDTGIRGGVVVTDETTGAAIGLDEDFPVRAASTSKVAVVMAWFRTVTEQGREAAEQDEQLISEALANSDNTATNALYTQLGATPEEQYRALLDVYELVGVEPDEQSQGWGESLVTAEDGMKLIRAVRNPPEWLGEDNARTMREAMGASQDGYDASQSFGVGVLARDEAVDNEVYLKNGWLAEEEGEWSVSSIGMVTGSSCDLSISITTFGAATSEEGMAATSAIAEPISQWCEAD